MARVIFAVQLPLSELADAELERLLAEELNRDSAVCPIHRHTTLSNRGSVRVCPVCEVEDAIFAEPAPVTMPRWFERLTARENRWDV